MASLIHQLKNYGGKDFYLDLLAGLSVAIVVIPQGMAYAVIAGLEPVYGLYAALLPLVIYILFASGPAVQIGPMALMSITVFSGISTIEEPGTELYLHLVLLTSLLAGIFQILFGWLKLGLISRYLSTPVLHGFMSAAGVIIISSQLKYLLTLKVPRSSNLLDVWNSVAQQLDLTNWYSLFLGLGGIALILILKRIHKLIPGYIIVAIAGSLLLYTMSLNDQGVPITGVIPQGLPSLYLDFITWDNVMLVLPTAFVVSLICFVGSFAISKAYENDYGAKVNPNQELIALGLSKALGSIFMAMPTTGSFSRSAVNHQSGARTGIAVLITAAMVAVTLMFLCDWFYYLPEPILAAIVISSVLSLIKWRQAKELWKVDRKDFWLLMATFLATILLGIVTGIVVGILLSLLFVVVRSSVLEPIVLGRIGESNVYRNIEVYPNARQYEGVLMMRYDHDIFFVNAASFYEHIVNSIEERNPKVLILNLGAVQYLDSVGVTEFVRMLDYCKEKGITLRLTNLIYPLREKLKHVDLFSRIEDMYYPDISSALDSLNTHNALELR